MKQWMVRFAVAVLALGWTAEGFAYQLRRSTNLDTWQNDNRTILHSGTSRYFTLTLDDQHSRRFFDLLVTAE